MFCTAMRTYVQVLKTTGVELKYNCTNTRSNTAWNFNSNTAAVAQYGTDIRILSLARYGMGLFEYY